MVSKWYLISKTKSSSYRKNILILLHKKEMTPRELEKETKIKISHISRALKELSKLGLVKCLTPSIRRSKIYSITKLGGDILEKL